MILKGYEGKSVLQNLTVFKDGKTYSLKDGNGFRMNQGVSFNSSIKFYEVNTRYKSIVRKSNQFEPITLEFSTTSTAKEIEEISSHLRTVLRLGDEVLDMTATYNDNKYVFEATFDGDTIEPVGATNLLHYTIRFQTRSFLFRLKTFVLDNLSTPDIEDDGYDNEYDHEYDGVDNTYAASILPITIDSEMPAPINVRLYNIAENPKIAINEDYTDTANSINMINAVNGITDVMYLKSLIPKSGLRLYQITGAGSVINLNQSREFINSRGYLTLDKVENIIFFNNVSYAEVDVYEPFNNFK